MSAELMALAESTKQIFRNLKEIAKICGGYIGGIQATAPRDIIGQAQESPEVHRPQILHANGNGVNCNADTVKVFKEDTDLYIRRVGQKSYS